MHTFTKLLYVLLVLSICSCAQEEAESIAGTDAGTDTTGTDTTGTGTAGTDNTDTAAGTQRLRKCLVL